MLQQPSQQRIGAGATARIHSRASSRASSSADSTWKAGLPSDGHQTGLIKDHNSADGYSHSRRSSVATNSNGDFSTRQTVDGKEVWPTTGSADGSASRGIDVSIAPVGFPPRPAQYAAERSTLREKLEQSTTVPTKAESRTQSFDPPAESMLYPQGKSVDYNPWIGNHPEDNLTEQTVKSGFQNKPSITNESNTARPSLWTHLKNKQGIQTLSSLFVAVLEKRQSSGRLVAPSTFKPPPRLSLTNTKREAWLSDLANPACAFRRFNRTIPYGINGKGLLEQCLAKEIPTARAVWLTKCVGANELRTLKRKGVSGALGVSAELKWIREWTMHVEQFADATIATCGELAWKEKIQYVIRLTYHLYIEQLLDQEHFLDWILSSLENTTVERLPLWLVHVQLYWRYLVCNRKRGRRLAEALCTRLEATEVEQQDSDVLKPAIQKLRFLLSVLAGSHRSCLIIPKSWTRFENLIQALSMQDGLMACVTNIVERNNRLAKPLWSQGSGPDSPPKRRAFRMLDKIDSEVLVPNICTALFETISSVEEIVKLVLQWCSSLYRQGEHRIYLASRILRRCGSAGADVERCVLSFIMDPPSSYSLNMHGIIKVVAELVRSRSFAVLKILRAVIARGAMTDNEHNPQAASRLRCLVQNLPTIGLPQHVEDLQRNLLRNAENPRMEESTVGVVQQSIHQALLKSSKPDSTSLTQVLSTISPLTLADKFKISAYVRSVVLRSSKISSFGEGEENMNDGIPSLTCQMFCLVREVLEALQDYPILADVIGISIRHGHGETLASAIDTIQYHKRCFAAIGALRPLSTEAIERYQTFRAELPLEKVYLSSLIGLLQSMETENSALLYQLKHDLARCDQRNAIAMCSPASDNALDIIATSSLETEDEIERILTSGTTMDEHSLKRVFQRLTSYLSSSSKATRGDWFFRLRAFDESTFDALMTSWLTEYLQQANTGAALRALPLLLGSEAISFQSLEHVAAALYQNIDAEILDVQSKLAVIMISILLLPDQSPRGDNLAEQYKFKLEQQNFRHNHHGLVLNHLTHALGVVDDDSIFPDMESLQSRLKHPAVSEFLLESAINFRDLLQESVVTIASRNPSSRTGFRIMKDLIDGLLYAKDEHHKATTLDQDRIPQLIRMVGELSLPLCQIEVQMLLGGHAKAPESSSEMATSLFEAIMRSTDSEQPPWLELMDGLDPGLLHRLRTMAEEKVLKVVNECLTRLKADLGKPDQLQISKVQLVLRKLLCIIDCTVSHSLQAALPSSLVTSESDNATTDRFGAVKDILVRHYSSEIDGKFTERRVCSMTSSLLQALMHLLVSRKLLSEGHKLGSADVASLLPILFAMFTQNRLDDFKSTADLIYDTAAYLSDDLTDEFRSLLIKSELPKYPDDPFVSFILGPPPTLDTWLGLVTTNQNVATPTTGTPSLSTPTARFGSQQSSNLRLQQQPVRPPTPQRANNPQPQPKIFNPPVPFPLRRWELLPDQGSSITANDTAISLSLVGARKV